MYLSHACDVFLALLGQPGVFLRPDSLVRTIILSKWQFWGQGLNFNAPGQGLAPRRGGGRGRPPNGVPPGQSPRRQMWAKVGKSLYDSIGAVFTRITAFSGQKRPRPP